MQKGAAPECLAKQVIESNYEAQGLDEVIVSWMAQSEQRRVVLPLAPKRQKLTISQAIPEARAETTASVLNSLIKHLAATPEAQ